MDTDQTAPWAHRDPWGCDDPPAVDPSALRPLPPRLAELASLRGPRPRLPDEGGWPEPSELPEVRVLQDAGWWVLEPAPALACLPAFWPPHLRCWVPDRLPRIAVEQSTSQHGPGVATVRPLTEAESARDDEHADHGARLAGLPPAPRRRIWLLRSPWPDVLPMPWLVTALQEVGWDAAGPRPVSDPLARAASRLLADASPAGVDGVLAEWRGRTASTASQWRRSAVRPPEAVELALAGAGPGDVADVAEALAGAGLPAQAAIQILLSTDPARASGWIPLLACGLTTVDELAAVHPLTDPADAAPLLRAGWTMRDLADLPEDGVEWDARGWRATGASARTVRRLLTSTPTLRPGELAAWAQGGVDAELLVEVVHADPTTVPQEWRAFASTGLPQDVALDWLAHGFSAAEAVVWEAAGVVPAEARVWRSRGLTRDDLPSQVEAADAVLPEGEWVALGRGRRSRVWSVTDPPGTRGRVAAEQQGGHCPR